MGWRDILGNAVDRMTQPIEGSIAHSHARIDAAYSRDLASCIEMIDAVPFERLSDVPLTEEEMLKATLDPNAVARLNPGIKAKEALEFTNEFLARMLDDNPMARYVIVQAINHAAPGKPISRHDLQREKTRHRHIMGNIVGAVHYHIMKAMGFNNVEEMKQGTDQIHQSRLNDLYKALPEWSQCVQRAADNYTLEPNLTTTEDIAQTRLDSDAVRRLVGDIGADNDKMVPIMEQFLQEGLGDEPIAHYAAIRVINDLPIDALSEAPQIDYKNSSLLPIEYIGTRVILALAYQLKQRTSNHEWIEESEPAVGEHTAYLLREREQNGNGWERQ